MSNDALWLNADEGEPSYTAAELRRAMAALLLQGQGDRFGARAGVRPGPDAVTLAGTTVTVHHHPGVAYPGLSTTAGPYIYQHVETTHELDPADGTNDRIDAIDIQTQDDDEDASGERRVRSVYVVGTPGASPSAPALTANSFRAATVLVPSGGTPAPTLTYVAPAAVTNGGVLPVRDDTELPTAGLYDGLYVSLQDVGHLRVRHGGAWVTVAEAVPEAIHVTFDTDKPVQDNVALAIQWTGASHLVSQSGDIRRGDSGEGREKIFIAHPGWYDIAAGVAWETNGNGVRRLRIELNGTIIADNHINAAGTSSMTVSAGTRVLAADDEIVVWVSQTSGVDLDILGDSRAFLTVARTLQA